MVKILAYRWLSSTKVKYINQFMPIVYHPPFHSFFFFNPINTVSWTFGEMAMCFWGFRSVKLLQRLEAALPFRRPASRAKAPGMLPRWSRWVRSFGGTMIHDPTDIPLNKLGPHLSLLVCLSLLQYAFIILHPSFVRTKFPHLLQSISEHILPHPSHIPVTPVYDPGELQDFLVGHGHKCHNFWPWARCLDFKRAYETTSSTVECWINSKYGWWLKSGDHHLGWW